MGVKGLPGGGGGCGRRSDDQSEGGEPRASGFRFIGFLCWGIRSGQSRDNNEENDESKTHLDLI